MNRPRAALEPGPVRGVAMDAQTRCAHYESPLDIIAVRMKCCGVYYACAECHEALAGHASETWPEIEWDERAVLCGACRTEMTIRQYLECRYICPRCGAHLNPACREHHALYFETESLCVER